MGVRSHMPGSCMPSIGAWNCPDVLLLSRHNNRRPVPPLMSQMPRDPPNCNVGSTNPARRALAEMRSIWLVLSSAEGHRKAWFSDLCRYALAIFTPLKMMFRRGVDVVGGVAAGAVGVDVFPDVIDILKRNQSLKNDLFSL